MFNFNISWEDKSIAIYFIALLLLVLLFIFLYKKSKNIFLTTRFFTLAAIIVIAFVGSYFLNELPFFQNIGFDPIAIPWALLSLFTILIIVDYLMLFSIKHPLDIKRTLPKVFSLGDQNPIKIAIKNNTSRPLKLSLIDELPIQFQKRDFNINLKIPSAKETEINYQLHPKLRGKYTFGHIHVFITASIQLLQRKYSYQQPMTLPVYPSLVQMKNFELQAFKQVARDHNGLKKMRRIGHSYEFEQIKNYVRGDDYRNINWKATSRSNKLMVNQFQEERAQQIYCIIDKSRNMKMPFDGLSLMDYAVNTALVISNTALKKHDRAGLITFSDIIGSTIKAVRKANQLNTILQTLYREKERNFEANFELLYSAVRHLISGRSLLFLFTNFESMYALERVLPLLRRINNQHLLVVIFFENTAIKDFSIQDATNVEGIYHQTIAQKYIFEKEQMVSKLNQYGIQAILTKPEELSLNAINKYLELKSRGLI